MNLNEIIREVAHNLDIPIEVCERAYTDVFKFIKQTINTLPLDKDLTPEEFSKLKTSFSIPYVGKLYLPEKRYFRHKSIADSIHKLKEKENDLQDKENPSTV